MAHNRVVLGAMSGTSADGVDVAAVRITGHGLQMRAELLTLATVPFKRSLREQILAMRADGQATFAGLATMGHELTLCYTRAAKLAMAQANLRPPDVACIGAHGQTLFHTPPLTIQWFDPSLLSAETGCTVVSDFRRADCAVGGEGAPLVPFADHLLFRSPSHNRVLLNIGGIANITYLPAGGSLDKVKAFDTGPGNCISDALARQWGQDNQQLSRGYDLNGRLAAAGIPDQNVVKAFLNAPYFRRKPPKTTDGPEMLALFQRAMGRRRLSHADALATACLCCARSVAQAIATTLPGKAHQIIAAGGGVNNRTLLRMLQAESGLKIQTTEQFGIPVEAREAIAFALLAAATVDRAASNVPAVTGARRPVVLGSITNAQVA